MKDKVGCNHFCIPKALFLFELIYLFERETGGGGTERENVIRLHDGHGAGRGDRSYDPEITPGAEIKSRMLNLMTWEQDDKQRL